MVAPVQIALWLWAVNLAAFLAFGWDKRLAQTGSRRIAESTLHGLALIGGSVGAVAGQHWFRHKTRKEPFRSTLYGIVAIQFAIVLLGRLRPDLIRALLQ